MVMHGGMLASHSAVGVGILQVGRHLLVEAFQRRRPLQLGFLMLLLVELGAFLAVFWWRGVRHH